MPGDVIKTNLLPKLFMNIELSPDCIIFVVFDRKIKKRRILHEK